MTGASQISEPAAALTGARTQPCRSMSGYRAPPDG